MNQLCVSQINHKSFNTNKNSKALAELLFEVTSEKQLTFILSSNQFNICHLQKFIDFSFEHMATTFKHDCMQFNPHLNYLKIPLLLKISVASLMKNVQSLCDSVPIVGGNDRNDAVRKLIDNPGDYKSLVKAMISFLEHVERLEHTCLAFIELKSIEKFFKQNIFKEEMFEVLVNLGTICMLYALNVLDGERIMRYDIGISLKCADLILKQKLLWNVINSSDSFSTNTEIFVTVLYQIIRINFGNTKLMSKFDIESLAINETSDCDKKAIFLAKFVELRSINEPNDYFKLEVRPVAV